MKYCILIETDHYHDRVTLARLAAEAAEIVDRNDDQEIKLRGGSVHFFVRPEGDDPPY